MQCICSNEENKYTIIKIRIDENTFISFKINYLKNTIISRIEKIFMNS